MGRKVRPFPLSDRSCNSSLHFRLPTPVVDRTGKIIAVLAGHPDDEGWEAVHLAAAQALEDARPRCQFPSSSLPHRRGKFSTLHGGVSFGNGQKQPLNLRNAGSPVNQEVADDLAKLSPFRRLAGFTSGESALGNRSALFNRYHL